MMWMLGKAIAPFFALVLILFIARPVSDFVVRKMPDGWMKRILLLRCG